MVEHINHIKMLAEHLEAIDDNIAEKDLVIILISSLPDEYNYLITALEMIDVRDRLIHEAEKMSRGLLDSKNPDASHDALVVKTEQIKSSATKNFKCHYCKRKGHYARDCYKRKADAKNSETENRAVGNFVADANASDEVALKSSLKCNEDNWWIDSGASQHMTRDKNLEYKSPCYNFLINIYQRGHSYLVFFLHKILS